MKYGLFPCTTLSSWNKCRCMDYGTLAEDCKSGLEMSFETLHALWELFRTLGSSSHLPTLIDVSWGRHTYAACSSGEDRELASEATAEAETVVVVRRSTDQSNTVRTWVDLHPIFTQYGRSSDLWRNVLSSSDYCLDPIPHTPTHSTDGAASGSIMAI